MTIFNNFITIALELQHVGVATLMNKTIPACYAECLPYLVDKASVYLRLHGSDFLQQLGIDLTLEQYIALDAVAAGTDLCQRDLAKILLKDRSNVTRILSILESKGLVKRIAAMKQNRPVKLISITNKGQKIIDKYSLIVKKDLEDFLSEFDDNELKQFKSTLEKMISKISEKSNIQI